MSDDAKQFEPGTYGCHEALHMASYFAGCVDTELCEHPAVLQNAHWLILAKRARDVLTELYTVIGKAHLEAGPASETHVEVRMMPLMRLADE